METDALVEQVVAFVERRVDDRAFEQLLYRHDEFEGIFGDETYLQAISMRWDHGPTVEHLRRMLADVLDTRGIPVDRRGAAERRVARRDRVLDQLRPHFPEFVRQASASRGRVTDLLPPASEAHLAELEAQLGLPLPPSYRRFLSVTRGFTGDDDTLRLDDGHPRPHPGLGGPSAFLSFADWWLEGDGDEALFVVEEGRTEGELPVAYYAHAEPRVEVVCGSFRAWVEEVIWRP